MSSTDQGQKRMRATDSVIADRQIFAAAASLTSERPKRSVALTRAGSNRATSGKGRGRNRLPV